MIACQTDSSVHDYIDAQDRWELWDLERISDEVLKLPRESGREVVRRFFGNDWCKAFLGIGSSSPFLPWRLYFARWLKKDRLFNHTWQLVGRKELVSALTEFCHDKKKRVALLVGRGGIGKSKLLHAFAEQFSSFAPRSMLWFVEENLTLTQENVDELSDAPGLIVIDDAHRADNLAPLFAAAVRPDSTKKLILATRPQRLDFLKAELTRSGFDYTEVIELPSLKSLSREDVKVLSRQALGGKLAHLDRRLADATWDCPLVTVVGGKLLADQSIDPQLLESHDGFRAEVLNRFQDIIVGRIADGDDPIRYSDLLQVLSATAPFLADDGFVKTVADFLQEKPDNIVKRLGELERIGVLLRRGRRLRITPDVLADHILHQACVAANGQPTGYAERIFEKFARVNPEKVFLNLAELDWRVQVKATRSDLLTTIWKQLETLLNTGSPQQKGWVVGLVKEVAYYQPEQALRMVELAIKHLPPALSRKPALFETSWATYIVHLLPEILQRCAYTLECLPKAARYLWELGKGDQRQLNQHPEHAFRLLTELAAYATSKPISFYQALLDTVVPWLKEPGIHSHAHSVIDILDKFLAKIGEDHWSEGAKMSWSRFPISRKKTAHLREKALDAICSCGETRDEKVILRVLKSLASILHPTLQFELGKVDRGQILEWEPDHLAAVAAVERFIKLSDSPIVQFRCLNVLQGHSRQEQSRKVGLAAKKAAALVQSTFHLRLVQAMARDDAHLWRGRHKDFDVAFEMHEQERKRFYTSIGIEVRAVCRSGDEAVKVIGGLLERLRKTDIPLYESPFFHELARSDMKFTAAMTDVIAEQATSSLSGMLNTFLDALDAFKPGSAVPYAYKAAKTRDAHLCFSVAGHLGWMARHRGLSKAEYTLLGRLLKHKNKNVVQNALQAIRWIGKKDAKAAIKLLLTVKWESDTQLTSAALSCIDERHGIPPNKVPEPKLNLMLRRLEKSPSIDNWEISEFIGHAATRLPIEVTTMLINRISRSSKRKNTDWFTERPLPHEFHHPLPDLSKHPDGIKMLRRIRDMTLIEQPWHYSHFGRDLYWLLGPIDFCLEILKEWFESGDNSKFRKALSLMSESESDFVFSRQEFVQQVMLEGQKLGSEFFDEAKSMLVFCATRHGESRTVGQPGPTTVATKEHATQLLKQSPTGSMMAELYESIIKHSESRLQRDKIDDEDMLEAE